MIDITMHVEGTVVLERHLSAMERRIHDLTPAWERYLPALRDAVRRAFATEGRSTGAAWKPLAPATTVQRKARGFGAAHPILVQTGDMRASLTEARHRNQLLTIQRGYMTYGTRDPKYKFHHAGTRRMPARPALVVTRQLSRQAARLVAAHIGSAETKGASSVATAPQRIG